jgi:hypothetical protein
MDVNRRDFNRLSMAVFGGMLAGATAGCGGGDQPAQQPPPTDGAGQAADASAAPKEIHACRGLNSCKGLGAGGDNSCAGTGACATAKAHTCAGMNECKNQGGCGEKPGYNDCKGMGGCGLPIHEGAWEMARKTFEEKMQSASKEFGAAPPRKEG